jgi:hypothetical protein
MHVGVSVHPDRHDRFAVHTPPHTYGAELYIDQRWYLYKDVAGASSHLPPNTGSSAASCPTANTWTKITIIVPAQPRTRR